MLVGDKARFAIEALAEEFPEGWVLGRFRFWLGGHPLGDWEDSVDLRGCVRWLRDFERTPRDRFDPGLEGLDASSVFGLVWEPVFGSEAIANPAEQPVHDAFARFHIGHLGMSSFDSFDVLLVKSLRGEERILWRRADESKIRELLLDAEEMEDVARRFCDEFERAYGARS